MRASCSIDRESNFLVDAVSADPGVVELLPDKDVIKRELDRRTRQSTRFAVLTMRDEDKADARQFFGTPLVFSIQEAKGLEYENIVLYGFVSGNRAAFHEIAQGVAADDLDLHQCAVRRDHPWVGMPPDAARRFAAQRQALRHKHLAAYQARNLKDVLRQCDQYGVDHRTPMHLTPLMAATVAGNVALVEALLDRGADPELTDHFGRNALHWARLEAFSDARYAAQSLPGLWERIAPAAIDVMVGNGAPGTRCCGCAAPRARATSGGRSTRC